MLECLPIPDIIKIRTMWVLLRTCPLFAKPVIIGNGKSNPVWFDCNHQTNKCCSIPSYWTHKGFVLQLNSYWGHSEVFLHKVHGIQGFHNKLLVSSCCRSFFQIHCFGTWVILQRGMERISSTKSYTQSEFLPLQYTVSI